MRITKDPLERKEEIMNVSEKLFRTKGYEDVSVNEIIEEIGIAKGTFYYYFKSKEDVLDEIVSRFISKVVIALEDISKNKELSAIEKSKKIITNLYATANSEFELMENLHNINNVNMHQKIIVKSTLDCAPLFAEVIEQGVKEGVFHTRVPLVATEYLLIGVQYILDPGIFHWDQEDLNTRVSALKDIMEDLFVAKKGTFSFIEEIFSNA